MHVFEVFIICSQTELMCNVPASFEQGSVAPMFPDEDDELDSVLWDEYGAAVDHAMFHQAANAASHLVAGWAL